MPFAGSLVPSSRRCLKRTNTVRFRATINFAFTQKRAAATGRPEDSDAPANVVLLDSDGLVGSVAEVVQKPSSRNQDAGHAASDPADSKVQHFSGIDIREKL